MNKNKIKVSIPTEPSPPSNAKISSVSNHYINLRWEKPKEINGNPRNLWYDITADTDGHIIHKSTQQLLASLDKLRQGSNYTITITADNGFMKSEPTDPLFAYGMFYIFFQLILTLNLNYSQNAIELRLKQPIYDDKIPADIQNFSCLGLCDRDFCPKNYTLLSLRRSARAI